MKNKIKSALNKYNIQLSEEKIDKLYKFIKIMKEYNKTHNITAITADDDIIFKHLVDSLLPINKIPNNIKVLDIGCGAGFPSIPLAIANETLQITAIDSVKKKTNFVELIKNNLNLDNLTVYHTRIEDIAQKLEFREQFNMVTSRAVAPLNVILEYSAPMLINKGSILAYKGNNYIEEIDNAKNALKILNCNIKEIYLYTIDEINSNRAVLDITKISKIPVKYPRKQNKPRLQPL